MINIDVDFEKAKILRHTKGLFMRCQKNKMKNMYPVLDRNRPIRKTRAHDQ